MERCEKCDCKDLYREKVFPKKWGIAILLVAIVASFWTYGLSLIGAAILDALIHKFIPSRLVCYRCRAVYTGVPIPTVTKGFDHHLSELYRYGQP